MKNKSRLEIVGHTKIWLRRKSGLIERIVDKPNAINDGLRAAFRQSWTDGANDFALNNLFAATEDLNDAHSQGGKDGIVALSTNLPLYSAITTSETAAETYGSKWRGEVVFSGPSIIASAALGKDYVGGSTLEGKFTTTYATQTFADTSVDNLDRLIFEWEIYS